VEACYPFMRADAAVELSAYAASAVSTALLMGQPLAQSSAYLPAPISVLLSPGRQIWGAAAAAFGIPFLATVTANVCDRFMHG
jgi:hypothetical protein